MSLATATRKPEHNADNAARPQVSRPSPTTTTTGAIPDQAQAESKGTSQTPRYLSMARPVLPESAATAARDSSALGEAANDVSERTAASSSEQSAVDSGRAAATVGTSGEPTVRQAGDETQRASSSVEQATEPLPPEAVDNTVVDAELSEVTAQPGVTADRQAGRPTLLKPSPGQESVREVAPQPIAPSARASPDLATSPATGAGGRSAAVAEKPADEEVAISASLGAQAKASSDAATRQASQGGAAQYGGTDDEGADSGFEISTEADADGGAGAGAGAAGSGAAEAGGGSGAGEAGANNPNALPAGAVPPAQPAALQAQVPQRDLSQDEFLEMFETGNTPEQDQALLAGLMASLRGEAEQEKAAIQAEAETQKSQILVDARAQAEAVSASATATIESIRGSFASAREVLTAATETRKAALTEQIAQQVAQIQTDSAAKLAEADAQLTGRQTGIADAATAQSARPQQLAEQEAARAEAALEAAAVECDAAGAAEAAKYPGSDGAAPDKRAAARNVADQSAADIRDKKAPLAEDIQSRATDSSARYAEYADRVSAQIEQARTDLLPSLEQFATEAIASLQQSDTGVRDGLDQRLNADLAALDVAEQSSIGQVEQAREAASTQIDAQANQACGDIDTQAVALLSNIDTSIQETEAVVLGGDDAYVPGMRDIIEATRVAISSTADAGRASLVDGATAAREGLASFATDFSTQMDAIAGSATEAADAIQQAADAAGDAMLQGQAQQGEQTATTVVAEQESLTSQVLVEIDAASAKAESDMAALTDQFATELHSGVDESIQEAILPRTDQVETRAHEAAQQVDDAWYVGLFRALGQIVIGLVIMVVLALVVAAVAAAFGVILTAWAAVMIAGAILLVLGFVLAIYSRARQPALANAPWYQVAGIALLDTVGYTGIHESIRGRDFVTGRRLSSGERTERGVMGAVTMISLVLGARAAIKGAPGGALTRPNWLPRGFVGRARVLPQAWRGSRVVGIEMWQGTRQGAATFSEWVRTRLLGREPTRPPADLLARVGEPSNTTTGSAPTDPRPQELPYRNPPEMAVARRGQAIDVSAMDPSRTYLWAVDGEGNVIIAPEQQAGFGRLVKHGDLVPGAGGEFRGSARAGGELNARVDPVTGEVTWVMDSNSSYSFARTDRGSLGEPSRQAAHDLLTQTGTNTEGIDVLADRGVPTSQTPLHAPAPPRPGAAPFIYPARRPPRTDDRSAPSP